MQYDFSEVTDLEDLRAVPEGQYDCLIAEVRESQSPAGHTRWGIRLEVIVGEWQGRTACWDSLHWSERGLPRTKYALRCFGVNTDLPRDNFKPQDLQGLRVRACVTAEETEDPVTGIRRLANRVPFAGYSPAAAAAAPVPRLTLDNVAQEGNDWTLNAPQGSPSCPVWIKVNEFLVVISPDQFCGLTVRVYPGREDIEPPVADLSVDAYDLTKNLSS